MRKFLALLLAALFTFSASLALAGELGDLGKKVEEVLSLIENYYYKSLTPMQNKAFVQGLEEALNEIMHKNLDPYSRVGLKPGEKSLAEKLSGKYVGIGVLFGQHPEDAVENIKALKDLYQRLGVPLGGSLPKEALPEDFKKEADLVGKLIGATLGRRGAYVEQVFKGGGADSVGIKKGWSILAVENAKGDLENMANQSSARILDLILGKHLYPESPEGTKVKIKFLRPDGQEVVLKVPRKAIVPPTVFSEMKNNDIGYVRLSSFGSVTVKDFEAAVRELKNQGMKKLILDVRKNPGGLESAADGVLDRLVPPGKILLFHESRGQKQAVMWSDLFVPKIFKGPIVVLIDGLSASASEIVAGVLKDHGLATLIGQKTFGKGVGQMVGDLDGGGEFILTTFEYVLPVSGYKVEGRGIEPDILVADNILTAEDDILEKAIEVLKTK